MSSPKEEAAHKTTPSDTAPEDSTHHAKEKHDSSKPSPFRLPPSEEQELLNQSTTQKLHANALFKTGEYSQAIQQYDTALSLCPDYFEYEIAVLKSNIAASYIKLAEWKEAITASDAALDALNRLTARNEVEEKIPPLEGTNDGEEEEDESEEIISPAASRLGALKNDDDRRSSRKKEKDDDIMRIKTKTLMRRAKARGELGGWSSLAGAEEDYKLLSSLPNLSPQDKKFVARELRDLHPRIETAKQKEMSEMMGKLKELGNGLLRPFGLSTDNFNVVRDGDGEGEGKGGFKVGFNQ